MKSHTLLLTAPRSMLHAAWCGCSILFAGIAAPSPALAIETSAVGVEGPKAAIGAVSIKMDASLAAMQAMLTNVLKCNTQRKFYAPADARKDANSCVGVADYDITTTNNSGVYAINSRASDYAGRFTNNNATNGYGLLAQGNGGPGVYSTSTASYGVYGNSTNSWSGYFAGRYGVNGQGSDGPGVYGKSASSYGVVGLGAAGYGVYGQSTYNWSGYFSGYYGVLGSGTYGTYGINTASGGIGVYGTTTTNDSWAAVFNSVASPYGVAITNATNTAQLCLNGTCTTTLNQAAQSPNGLVWGGSYITTNYGCQVANPATNACSCPTGYSYNGGTSGASGGYVFYFYNCYKGTFHT